MLFPPQRGTSLLISYFVTLPEQHYDENSNVTVGLTEV